MWTEIPWRLSELTARSWLSPVTMPSSACPALGADEQASPLFWGGLREKGLLRCKHKKHFVVDRSLVVKLIEIGYNRPKNARSCAWDPPRALTAGSATITCPWGSFPAALCPYRSPHSS